ncbi:MAG: NAD(P)H-dependent glycerol-3-phosphate dehydrogenase [candidate division WOR-3 bacterium]
MSIGFIGAGRWGIALALILNRKGVSVKMWEYDPGRADALNEQRKIPELPATATIPETIVITNNLTEVLTDAEILVFAVPAQTLRSVVTTVYEAKPSDETILVSVVKGIDQNTLKRMSEVIREKFDSAKLVVLAGPGIPYDVVAGSPTSLVAASDDAKACTLVQEVFSFENLRVYSHSDVVGVELGGALKNVIAIAAGICDGLNLGINAKAALLTRGLAEITRLGIALNANPLTFAGLSGMGDLIVTAFSPYSRNWQVGKELAKSKSLKSILESLPGTAEGVATAKAGIGLANKFRIEMPLTEEVNRILFENSDPRVSLQRLLKRQLKAELWR